jgi:hypothetical protein
MLKRSLVLLIGSILLMLIANTAFAATYLNIGMDTGGTLTSRAYGFNSSTDVNDGFTFGLESVYPLRRRNAECGFGFEYQAPRTRTNYAGDFKFVPLYWVVNSYLSRRKLGPYFTGRMGYNLFYGDSTFKGTASLNGGLYYGFGFGFRPVNQMKVELLYSENRGSIDGSVNVPGHGLSDYADVTYSKISLVTSYRF